MQGKRKVCLPSFFKRGKKREVPVWGKTELKGGKRKSPRENKKKKKGGERERSRNLWKEKSFPLSH